MIIFGKKLEELAVALIQPTYPVNVGHVARLLKNFGISSLYVVDPRFDMNEAKVFASHGASLLRRARKTEFQTLQKNFDILVGSTAVTSKKPSNLLRKTLTLEELPKRLSIYTGRVCLVLGRETTGLTNEELEFCDIIVHIETGTSYKTLNVAHALAIMLYRLSPSTRKTSRGYGSRKDRERLIAYAIELAGDSGYPSHKRHLLKTALKSLLAKGDPTSRETFLIIGLLRRAILALGRRHQ